MWKNIGEMQNQGFELSIGGDIIRTKDWDWNIEINLGHNKNKLKKLYKTKNAEGQFVESQLLFQMEHRLQVQPKSITARLSM